MSAVQSTVEYRDIPGFPGYRVGSDGSVWSCRRKGSSGKLGATWRPLRLKPARCGRLKVNLCNGAGRVTTRFVHHLVLESFVGPRPHGCEACHFPDPDVTNNRPDNLRWDTPKANSADKVLHGTMLMGERSPVAKLTEDIVRQLLTEFPPDSPIAEDAGQRYGVTATTIRSVVRRRTWKHVTLSPAVNHP